MEAPIHGDTMMAAFSLASTSRRTCTSSTAHALHASIRTSSRGVPPPPPPPPPLETLFSFSLSSFLFVDTSDIHRGECAYDPSPRGRVGRVLLFIGQFPKLIVLIGFISRIIRFYWVGLLSSRSRLAGAATCDAQDDSGEVAWGLRFVLLVGSP